MGRPKGCKGGPGRPKATAETRKQYGKTSVSFNLAELRVLNRMLRNNWWRQQMRASGCCKCTKKEKKCKQVHHLFHFLASGNLDNILVNARNEIADSAMQLVNAQTTDAPARVAARLIELADKLPQFIPCMESTDDIDFAEQKKDKPDGEGEDPNKMDDAPVGLPSLLTAPATYMPAFQPVGQVTAISTIFPPQPVPAAIATTSTAEPMIAFVPPAVPPPSSPSAEKRAAPANPTGIQHAAAEVLLSLQSKPDGTPADPQ